MRIRLTDFGRRLNYVVVGYVLGYATVAIGSWVYAPLGYVFLGNYCLSLLMVAWTSQQPPSPPQFLSRAFLYRMFPVLLVVRWLFNQYATIEEVPKQKRKRKLDEVSKYDYWRSTEEYTRSLNETEAVIFEGDNNYGDY